MEHCLGSWLSSLNWLSIFCVMYVLVMWILPTSFQGKFSLYQRDGVPTELGAEQRYYWDSFRNMLRDIAHLEEAEIQSLVLWNRLLVYATLFGFADQVSKVMKLRQIHLENPSMDAYVYTPFRSNLIHSSRLLSNYGTTATTASHFTVSSGGSSGGGFSGGGGGGGEGQQKSATATATLTSYADILGNIFNKKDDAQAKLSEFTTAADEVAKVAKDAGKGLFLMTNGDKVTAFGTGSRFDVVFDEFGVTPAVEDVEAATHGEAIDFEFIGDADPDLLFVLDRSAAIGQEGTPAKEVLNNDIVTATKAWKNNKVFYVNGVDWYIIGEGFTASPRMAEEIKNDLSS